jgi:2-dehydro-3-deoxyphosphogluconate aldolase/(4S)-4-hydroxy-2-oxoglutarate aldolase
MTPTEIVRAWKAGASAVKVFPAGTLGAGFFREVRGPLNHIPFIATGGVTLGTCPLFCKAGAMAVGVGGSLVDKTLIENGRFDELQALTQKYVAAAQISS